MLTLALVGLAPEAAAQNRIVNGQDATDFSQYPEVVMVRSTSGNCTGSLIHSEWILTAAHCWDDLRIADNPDGNTNILFGFGENPSQIQQVVDADLVIIHENYLSIGPSENGTPNTAGGTLNDVALVHLSEPVPFGVMALNPNELTDDWIGLDLTFIGFGITEWGGGGGGTKRFVSSPLFSYSDPILQAFDPVNSASTCQGDSGGPAVLYQGAGYIQVGITAFGVECGTSPGSYMRVDYYLPWIEENLPPGTPLLKVAASPPTIECSHQLDPDSAETIALGIVPMDLRCEVVSAEPESITEVEWQWGDGTAPEVVTDLRAMHTYTEMGVYNLAACVRGERIASDGSALPYENCVSRPSHVNACGVPDVSFEVEQGDGLELELFNTTPLRAYTCITNARWEIYEGDAVSGEPILEFANWDPQVELEKPGTYTIVLNVGGLGGTGGAVSTIKVGAGTGCSTGGASPVGLAAMLSLGLLAVRRRRA